MHFHGSFPLYLRVSYILIRKSLILSYKNETGCFEKWSFLKAGLYYRGRATCTK